MTYQSYLMQLPDMKSAKQIAAGGEGVIYEHPKIKNKVIKVYHTPRPLKYKDHLETLSALPENLYVIPKDIYHDKQVLGFSMDYVNFNDYWLFNNLFNKGFCTANSITKDFKIGVIQELKKAVEFLHAERVHVGDLNQYNIFVSKNGKVLFVDVDSFQTQAVPHSGVLLDDVRDWTTAAIDSKSDSWAFDILAFWATTYCHPFKWVVPGNKESIELRVKTNKSFLSKIAGIKIPPLYEPPVGEPLKQFKDIFGGRRFMVDFGAAHMPIPVVIKQQVSSQSLSIRVLFEDVTEVYSATDRISVKSKGIWFLVETALAKVARTLTMFDTKAPYYVRPDVIYPAKNNFVNLYGNSLHGGINTSKQLFIQPEYYFNDGSLSILDYATDIQWNFDLNMQMAGISKTQTSVFAKSVTYRSSPIQNFGKQKFLNIPVGNSYQLIQLPDGTKDAVYVDGRYAVEYKLKNKVLYTLQAGRHFIGLDYLPYFATKGDTIFLPDDGFIAVYNSTGDTGIQLDCSMCTRSSRLYGTTSGILLLENNILYLLNTK